LTNEYILAQRSFDWGQATIEQLVFNAVQASLLPDVDRALMVQEFQTAFESLKAGAQ
jgi:adenosine deaminase